MGPSCLNRALVTVFALALAGPPRALAATSASREIEAKVTLEAALEKRLQSVLQKVLDTQDLIVIVNVEIFSDSGEKEPQPEIMPGVPIKDSPGIPGALGLTMSMVRRVSATVILDDSTSESDVALVRKTSAGILGISPDRQDQLSVEKMRFRRPRPTRFDASEFLRPGTLLSLLWLALAAGLALVLYATLYRRVLFPALRLAEQAAAARMEAANREQTREDVPPEEKAGVPDRLREKAAPEMNGAGPKLPFHFISERHLPMLNFLLRKAEPRTVAVILHYLPPRLASSALAGLTQELRKAVMATMSQVVQLDESQVRATEDWLRSRIDFMTGGEDKLAEILDEAPAGLRAELMGVLAAGDKALGERLQHKVVLLEDLARLDAVQLKALSRRVPMRSLAAVLKYSEGLRNALLPKLSAGLGQWLSQEIQFSGELTPDRVQVEQGRVLAVLQAMVKEGAITLQKDPPNGNKEA